MSGGHYDYKQHQIGDIIDRMESDLEILDGEMDHSVRAHIVAAIYQLKLAQVYVQRLDWFMSGDDGEDSFHRRLASDIAEL